MLNNLDINNLYQSIMSDITTASLPVGIVYFVLKDIINDVEVLYNQTVLQEIQSIKENDDNE